MSGPISNDLFTIAAQFPWAQILSHAQQFYQLQLVTMLAYYNELEARSFFDYYLLTDGLCIEEIMLL